MRPLTVFAVLCCVLALTGCEALNLSTPVGEIRGSEAITTALPDVPLVPTEKCETGHPEEAEPTASIEAYSDYWLSYVEFDDQGWSYSDQAQLKRLDARLREEVSKNPHDSFEVIVFIHGWHHNAHDNDCNVREFKSLLRAASARFSAMHASHELLRKRRVVGVYVGWRGESIPVPYLKQLSFLDRRNSAEHVAKGEVREVFATLRKIEIEANPAEDGSVDSLRPPNHVRSLVIGHSFGGLIAFNSLSQAMLSELVAGKPRAGECQNGGIVQSGRTWPDMLVLINPAFEATRFQPLHNAVQKSDGCPYSGALRPKVIVVTADNDGATGSFFPVARQVLTVFEKYSNRQKVREKEANLHAIGFVPEYRTHRLCMSNEGGSPHAAAEFRPSDPAQMQDERAPVWVVGTEPSIVNGHNGFLYARQTPGQLAQPYLLNWLLDVTTPRDDGDDSLPSTSRVFVHGFSCPEWAGHVDADTRPAR